MLNNRVKLFGIIAAMLTFGMGFGIQAKIQTDVQEKIRGQQNERLEQEGRPAPELEGYWQRLAANSAEPMAIAWSRQTGAAESIFGKLSEPVAVSEQAARRFLGQNAPIFRMDGDLQDLELIRNFESPMGRHFFFKQVYQGVQVYGSEAAVHFNKEGRVVAVNNTYQPKINISVLPSVDLNAAMGTASLVVFANDFSQASGELVVYRFDEAYALAWRISVPTSHKTWELFIDAHSGAVLGSPRDVNRYAIGTGQIFNVNAVVATKNNGLRDNNDAASAVPTSAYSTVTLLGLVGNGLLDGQYASSSKTKKRVSNANNNFVFNRSSDGFSEVMGYYYVDFAQRYIQTTLNFANVNNRQQVFSANGTRQDNSFYSPSTKLMTFGTGGVDDAEDAEVILHEYGHSIQDNQKSGFGSNAQAGAMGEGFGDYWAGSVSSQIDAFQNLCVAEWDATSYSSTNPPCLRRLDSTKHYPENIVGEVHADGEIWSAALWQIRTAVGATKADKVILQHHFMINANASFNQAADALVTAAINLGFTTNEVNSIRTILQNRGFTVTV